MAGRFVVFEGIDGSGTSTQAAALTRRWRDAGHDVMATAEPSSGPYGLLLRQALRRERSADESEMAVLFAQDRRHHLDNVIEPALAEGQRVICERYLLSNLAYQSSLGLELGWLAAINSGVRIPDITIILDHSGADSMARLRRSRAALERYESETILHAVRQALLDISRTALYPGAVVVLDASATIDEVERQVQAALQ